MVIVRNDQVRSALHRTLEDVQVIRVGERRLLIAEPAHILLPTVPLRRVPGACGDRPTNYSGGSLTVRSGPFAKQERSPLILSAFIRHT